MTDNSPTIEELRGDLRDALNFGIGDEPTEAQLVLAEVAVNSLESYDDIYDVLEIVLKSLGPEVFGGVVLHGLEFDTSLKGFVRTMISPQTLSALGISLRELQWPEEDYQWPWKDEAPLVNGNEIAPAVDFDAAQLKARELGYTDPSRKALVEHHLVEHRLHGPRVAATRAVLDGFHADNWSQIIEAFTVGKRIDG